MPRLPSKWRVDVANFPRLPHKVPASRATSSDQVRHETQPSAISAMRATQNKVDATKCHACPANRRSMSPSATPAKQSATASPVTSGAQARHQSQPSAIRITRYAKDTQMPVSATCATRLELGCRQVPRLPRKVLLHGASTSNTC